LPAACSPHGLRARCSGGLILPARAPLTCPHVPHSAAERACPSPPARPSRTWPAQQSIQRRCQVGTPTARQSVLPAHSSSCTAAGVTQAPQRTTAPDPRAADRSTRVRRERKPAARRTWREAPVIGASRSDCTITLGHHPNCWNAKSHQKNPLLDFLFFFRLFFSEIHRECTA